MALDLNLIGQSWSTTRSWSSDDTLLYALAVGSGSAPDPPSELAWSVEGAPARVQMVLPSFATVIGESTDIPPFGDFDVSQCVHAEESVTIHTPLPAAGSVVSTSTITGMYDKGSGVLVVVDSKAVCAESSRPIADVRRLAFVIGERSNTQESPPPDAQWHPPVRTPDSRSTHPTTRQQALLYRLTGDRNPLHYDPDVASAGGFERPILHGLCTYGFATRAVLLEVCDGEVERFGSIHGRFTRPVLPGDELEISIWRHRNGASFQVRTDRSGVVIDRGEFRYSPELLEASASPVLLKEISR